MSGALSGGAPGTGSMDPAVVGWIYGAAIFLFLVTVGARLPWTRVGGLVLATLAGLGAWRAFDHPTLGPRLVEPDSLPVLVLVILSCVVGWWTLHREQIRSTPPSATGEGGVRGRRARLATIALGLAAVAVAAYLVPAPLPSLDASSISAGGSDVSVADGGRPTERRSTTPWFLAGLELLGIAFLPVEGPSWPLLAMLFAMAAALWLAPHLETRDPETEAPFGGRRDEVPFFLFAWTFLGWLPIALAVFLEPLSATEASLALRPLSERFWIDLLGLPLPSWWLPRELPGLLLLLLLFVVAPWKLPTWKPTRGAFARHRRRLGRGRYWLVTMLAAFVVFVPAQLLAALLLGIGPWLRLPGPGIGP